MAEIFTEDQIIDLVKRHSEGEKGLMNRALIMWLVCTGTELVEATDLEIRHIMEPSGKLRPEFRLSEELAYNKYKRVIDIVHPILIKMLNEYLDDLAAKGDPEGIEGEYRGLHPTRPVFTNKKGERFGITKRGNGRGTATGIRAYLKELIDRSGLTRSGFQASSFRRTWLINHHRMGMNHVNLMAASGIRSITSLRKKVYDDSNNVTRRINGLYSRL